MDHELQAKATEMLRELLAQIGSGKVEVTEMSVEAEILADTGAETGRRTLRLTVNSPDAKKGVIKYLSEHPD